MVVEDQLVVWVIGAHEHAHVEGMAEFLLFFFQSAYRSA
jgi:hypothetical protein